MFLAGTYMNIGCEALHLGQVATIDSGTVWGNDEITWFCLQEEGYRKRWLRYAYDWIRENDPNGFLQMPVKIKRHLPSEEYYRGETEFSYKE